MNIQIRNQLYSRYQLEQFITDKVREEVKEYQRDPNCYPDLWAADSNMTENEQIAFIYLATSKKQ